ncbi:MAG: hypothetical protein SVY53_04235 [Chloroflexota bacterium]|nr:hypothetical protein [Chloroflexota bacterium]
MLERVLTSPRISLSGTWYAKGWYTRFEWGYGHQRHDSAYDNYVKGSRDRRMKGKRSLDYINNMRLSIIKL